MTASFEPATRVGRPVASCCEGMTVPRRTVICVHGMTAGAWVWEEAVAPALEARGHRVVAIDLPRKSARPSLAVYRDAVAEVLVDSGPEAVLVGHSLGGAAVQAVMAAGHVYGGAALLAPVPPYGLWRASAEMALRHPRLWREIVRMGTLGVEAADTGLLRRHLFPEGIETPAFESFMARTADEPPEVLRDAFGWPPFAPVPGPGRPVLVLGGTNDHFVPATDLRLTAAWYGTAPRMLDGAGHMLMCGARGAESAQVLADWLEDLPGP